jgi:hypothetical protein
MATEISAYAVKYTAVAGADLSTHQYKFVKQNASGQVILCAAVTDKPIGVLQNAPKSGEEAEVVVIGGTKIKGGEALAVDSTIGTDASGTAQVVVAGTETTVYAVGRVILSATTASGGLASALVNCLAGRAS